MQQAFIYKASWSIALTHTGSNTLIHKSTSTYYNDLIQARSYQAQ